MKANFSIIAILAISIPAFADMCPAINCDCGDLQNPQWQASCERHEQRIKKACEENLNTPKDYCSIHGLDARPLPLAIEVSDFEMDADVDLKLVEGQIDSLYLAMDTYTAEAREALELGNEVRVMQILKVVDSNIDKLLTLHQQVEAVFKARGSKKKATAHWREAGEATAKYAGIIEAFATELSTSIDQAKDPKQRKRLTVLAKKSMRMTGKAYEHGAYAYGVANRNADAAATWRRAADVSTRQIGLNLATGEQAASQKFNEFQAAARLQRAAYHHLADSDQAESLAVLKQSQQFVNREEQTSIGELVNVLESESDDGGVLSGR